MSSRRNRLDSLRALGRLCPPSSVCVKGVPHVCRQVFKHDFFAATSLYESKGTPVVVKIGRRADCLGNR